MARPAPAARTPPAAEIRDRGPIPSKPHLPWSLAGPAPSRVRRDMWRRANRAIDFVRLMTAGSLGPLSSASATPTRWDSARPTQREAAFRIWRRWLDWEASLEAAPPPAAAASQLPGPVRLSYDGVPDNDDGAPLLDSKGRPRLPPTIRLDVRGRRRGAVAATSRVVRSEDHQGLTGGRRLLREDGDADAAQPRRRRPRGP